MDDQQSNIAAALAHLSEDVPGLPAEYAKRNEGAWVNPETNRIEVKRVSYTHAAIIDAILANPSITQGRLSEMFGYTQAQTSIIVNSESFKKAMRERKAELVDPLLQTTIEDKLYGLVDTAIDTLMPHLANGDKNTALRALEIGSRAMGMGVAKPQQVAVNNYVAVVPERAKTADDWAAMFAEKARQKAAAAEIIEHKGASDGLGS